MTRRQLRRALAVANGQAAAWKDAHDQLAADHAALVAEQAEGMEPLLVLAEERTWAAMRACLERDAARAEAAEWRAIARVMGEP